MKQRFLLLLMGSTIALFSCQKEKVIGSRTSNSSQTSNNIQSNGNASSNTPPNFTGTYAINTLSLLGASTYRISGAGWSTILETSSFVADATVNRNMPAPYDITGLGIFGAGNGDELHTQFSGTLAPTGPNSIRISFKHTITGGTGVFANASGSFIGTTVTTNNLYHTMSFEGIINH